MMGKELILRGRSVSGSMDIEDGLVSVEDGRIRYAGPASDFPGDVGTPAIPGRILLPGLVDLHTHGAHGTDFAEGSEAGARVAARYLHSRGTTTLLASLVTGAPADLVRNLKVLRSLADEGLIAGSHLEGPFLSGHQCGAHDPALLLEPDLDLVGELFEAAGPTLASMTLAAELPGATALVDLLTSRGVVPSLGHTAVDHAGAALFLERSGDGLASGPSGSGYDSVRRQPTVTHLFNAMPTMHHRAPGPVSACLSAARAGNAVVELIADGVHLVPETVKTVFELVGAENIALVTDSMAATGLADGQYRLGALAVTVDGGVARVDSTGAIAGGTATLLEVVRSAVAAGVSLQEAVRSATAVPASVLGLSRQAGDLRPGMLADVLVVDAELDLEGVLRRGEWVASP
jgi:N-acetylglucosamine-6-phosphate deacetylase